MDWYESLADGSVLCGVCCHGCRIAPGKIGRCGVRENQGGILVSRNHGRIIARQVDPIEKKPIHHMLPGSLSYSIAAAGCNFQCQFCQNASIAQLPLALDRGAPFPGKKISPGDLISAARDAECASIAYTYTEPTVFLETLVETARLAKSHGLLNIMVTNGYMGKRTLPNILDCIDGANVDLKAFNPDFYRRYCRAELAPVLKNLRALKRGGVWVEVTTLIIPGLNDDPRELGDLASFIAHELGPDTPWHVSRFHPCHDLLDRGPTPLATLEKAVDIGRDRGLNFIYLGNVPGNGYEDTRCPSCQALLVARRGGGIQNFINSEGGCPSCSTRVPGIF